MSWSKKISLMFFSLLSIVFLILSTSIVGRFTLKEVEIQGLPETWNIMSLVLSEKGRNKLTVDKRRIKKEIENLLYVSSAEVSIKNNVLVVDGIQPELGVLLVDGTRTAFISEDKKGVMDSKDYHALSDSFLTVEVSPVLFDVITSSKDEKYREYLYNLAKEKGNQYVHNMLYDIDIESFNSIHFNNLKRVIRALEVYKITNKPFSSFKEDQNNIYESPYNIYYYVLNMDREKLYCRINKRVDMMLEKGLLEEVKSLKNMGLIADMQSMKGIGYKELLYYLDDKISFEEAVEMIKQGSRNYAKRQLTWFRKDPRAIFINKDDFMDDKEIITKIIGDIKKS